MHIQGHKSTHKYDSILLFWLFGQYGTDWLFFPRHSKEEFYKQGKNIIIREVEMLYTFYETEIEKDIRSSWTNVIYKIHRPTGIQLTFPVGSMLARPQGLLNNE